jgi:IS30 family transposase
MDMCQNNYNTKSGKGKHLTWEDRKIIAHLYNIQGKSKSKIADELGKHRTTISREIKKGQVELLNSDYTTRKEYVAEKAQEAYERNATSKGPKIKIAKEHELAEYIEEQVKEKKRSPEVIANEIKDDDRFDIKLHWRTIYNYIDKGILMIDREDLTYGRYKKKSNSTQKREKESTRQHKEGRKLSDRPEEADKRVELGHWEMDLLEGKKGKDEPFLLVLKERVSRKEIIEKLPDKRQESVIKGLDRVERKMGVKEFRRQFKTITTDNGKEFYDYEGIETSFTKSNIPRAEQYYADAYCSWQRGSNENLNKMIRRFIPKGTSLKKYSSKAIKKIQKWINDYPRKMFNFKTAGEVFEKRLKSS